MKPFPCEFVVGRVTTNRAFIYHGDGRASVVDNHVLRDYSTRNRSDYLANITLWRKLVRGTPLSPREVTIISECSYSVDVPSEYIPKLRMAAKNALLSIPVGSDQVDSLSKAMNDMIIVSGIPQAMSDYSRECF